MSDMRFKFSLSSLFSAFKNLFCFSSSFSDSRICGVSFIFSIFDLASFSAASMNLKGFVRSIGANPAAAPLAPAPPAIDYESLLTRSGEVVMLFAARYFYFCAASFVIVVLSILGLLRLSSVIPYPSAYLFSLAALFELRMGLASSAAGATALFLLAFNRPTDFSIKAAFFGCS